MNSNRNSPRSSDGDTGAFLILLAIFLAIYFFWPSGSKSKPHLRANDGAPRTTVIARVPAPTPAPSPAYPSISAPSPYPQDGPNMRRVDAQEASWKAARAKMDAISTSIQNTGR